MQIGNLLGRRSVYHSGLDMGIFKNKLIFLGILIQNLTFSIQHLLCAADGVFSAESIIKKQRKVNLRSTRFGDSMKKLFLLSFFFVLGFGFWGGCEAKGEAGLPPVIPMKDFFRNQEKAGFQLSPNGQYLAFMEPWKNRMNVHVQKIGEKKAVRITNAIKRDIAGYFWANNHRIAFVQDKGGDENFRLYAVDIDGSGLKELTPFDQVRVRIIDDLEDNEKEMIIGMNRRDKRIFDAYRININTGEMKMVAKNPGNIDGWLTDKLQRSS